MHLHIRYGVVAVAVLIVASILIRCDVAQRENNEKPVSPSAPVKVQPKTISTPPVVTIHKPVVTITHNEPIEVTVARSRAEAVDESAKDNGLVAPNGYVIEQIVFKNKNYVLSRAVIHSNVPRICIFNADHSVIGVCYKAP